MQLVVRPTPAPRRAIPRRAELRCIAPCRAIPYRAALRADLLPAYDPGALPPASVAPPDPSWQPAAGPSREGWSGTGGSGTLRHGPRPPGSASRGRRSRDLRGATQRATAKGDARRQRPPVPTGSGAGGHGRGSAHVRSRAPLPARALPSVSQEESLFRRFGRLRGVFFRKRSNGRAQVEGTGRPPLAGAETRRASLGHPERSGTAVRASGPRSGAPWASGPPLRAVRFASSHGNSLSRHERSRGSFPRRRRCRYPAGPNRCGSRGLTLSRGRWGLNPERDGAGAPEPGETGRLGAGLRRAGKCKKQNLGSGPAPDGQAAPDRYLGTVAPLPRPVGSVVIGERGGLRLRGCRGSPRVLLLSSGSWQSPR